MDPDRRCTARAKHSGNRCKRAAVPGGTVCSKHGGSAPQVRAAAERRVARQEALRAAERTFGMPLQGAVDPDALVLQELAYTAGAVGWLRERVGGLDADALVWGVTVEDHRTSGVGRAGTDVRREAKPHPYVALLGEWSDRLTKQAETAVRMGIERRQVELAEALGGQLADVLAAVLDELELSPAQRVRAREVVPARLKAISGGLA